MPEDSKKNSKGRNEAKEQRKPRQGRHQGGSHDRKHEKTAEEPKLPQKTLYEEPGPEFYQNLKRETDEILKITEEANSKYKKKEIQSNWAKYEMPIESYDEIEEQENMGADYEKLIEAPLSIGGHFQFKHEKSWDTDSGSSPYDKYFEINMDNLFLSISTIPFHERINIDKSIYSETDVLSMNNRATRFKQKYYKDKTFTTPELKMQDKILNNLIENVGKTDSNDTDSTEEELDQNKLILEQEHNRICNENLTKQIQGLGVSDFKSTTCNVQENSTVTNSKELNPDTILTVPPTQQLEISRDLDNFDDFDMEAQTIKQPKENDENSDVKEMLDVSTEKPQLRKDSQKNPVIESPEDLEKWLDDFLDG